MRLRIPRGPEGIPGATRKRISLPTKSIFRATIMERVQVAFATLCEAKENATQLTRDVPAKQKLGAGWLTVPANP